jgi:hypothetical protein
LKTEPLSNTKWVDSGKAHGVSQRIFYDAKPLLLADGRVIETPGNRKNTKYYSYVSPVQTVTPTINSVFTDEECNDVENDFVKTTAPLVEPVEA